MSTFWIYFGTFIAFAIGSIIYCWNDDKKESSHK